MLDPLIRGHKGLSSEAEEDEEQGMDVGGSESGTLHFLASDLTHEPSRTLNP